MADGARDTSVGIAHSIGLRLEIVALVVDAFVRELSLVQTKARFSAAVQHHGRDALHFTAAGALNGELWFDARESHVIEAQFAEPNHEGCKDFNLTLKPSSSIRCSAANADPLLIEAKRLARAASSE